MPLEFGVGSGGVYLGRTPRYDPRYFEPYHDHRGRRHWRRRNFDRPVWVEGYDSRPVVYPVVTPPLGVVAVSQPKPYIVPARRVWTAPARPHVVRVASSMPSRHHSSSSSSSGKGFGIGSREISDEEFFDETKWINWGHYMPAIDSTHYGVLIGGRKDARMPESAFVDFHPLLAVDRNLGRVRPEDRPKVRVSGEELRRLEGTQGDLPRYIVVAFTPKKLTVMSAERGHVGEDGIVTVKNRYYHVPVEELQDPSKRSPVIDALMQSHGFVTALGLFRDRFSEHLPPGFLSSMPAVADRRRSDGEGLAVDETVGAEMAGYVKETSSTLARSIADEAKEELNVELSEDRINAIGLSIALAMISARFVDHEPETEGTETHESFMDRAGKIGALVASNIRMDLLGGDDDPGVTGEERPEPVGAPVGPRKRLFSRFEARYALDRMGEDVAEEVNSQYTFEEFMRGLNRELKLGNHGDDPYVLAPVVLAALRENPRHYAYRRPKKEKDPRATHTVSTSSSSSSSQEPEGPSVSGPEGGYHAHPDPHSGRRRFEQHDAEKVARSLGDRIYREIVVKYTMEQFTQGMNVELEHGTVDEETNVTHDDPQVTGKIALAHLREIPDYYVRLEAMEDEAKRATSSASSSSEKRKRSKT